MQVLRVLCGPHGQDFGIFRPVPSRSRPLPRFRFAEMQNSLEQSSLRASEIWLLLQLCCTPARRPTDCPDRDPGARSPPVLALRCRSSGYWPALPRADSACRGNGARGRTLASMGGRATVRPVDMHSQAMPSPYIGDHRGAAAEVPLMRGGMGRRATRVSSRLVSSRLSELVASSAQEVGTDSSPPPLPRSCCCCCCCCPEIFYGE